MSIATLKKKSRVVYGERVNSSTVSQNGFSLNGIKRVIGSVGQTNLAKSVTRTPFKGTEPKGRGGGKPCRLSGRFARICGSSGYPTVVSNSGSCSTNQILVKLSTKNTKGMINTKYKWIHSAYPRYCVHEVDKINDAGQYIEDIKTKAAGCTISKTTATTKSCTNRYHIGGKYYMKDICTSKTSEELAAVESYNKYMDKLKAKCLQLKPLPYGVNKNQKC